MKQLGLFSIADELAWLRDPEQRDKRRGRYTPTEIINAVKNGIALCLTDRAIGRQLGLDGHTVASIRLDLERSGEIPQVKERLAGKLFRVGEAWFDRFNEAVVSGRVNPSQLPIPAGIALTKGFELTGGGFGGPVAAVQVNVSLSDLRKAVSSESESDGEHS